MDSNELHNLIDKYLQGTASEAERERLLSWYRQQPPDDNVWLSQEQDEEAQVRGRMREQIWARLDGQAGAKPAGRLRFWYYGAVAAVLLAVIAVGLWQLRVQDAAGLIAQSPVEQQENRFVLLPDSSRVLLRPGSKLHYRSDFTGATREVELEGEAYFDVNRREKQPFIIYTGEVKTVVLGTAFTIKADAGQKDVQVTVQRGKVRVERAQRVLATLTANQQVHVAEQQQSLPQQKPVESRELLRWTANDVSFDSQPFGELTDKLQRRYGAKIIFNNPGLADCPVTGRFVGIETLEEMLDILCDTRGATYKVDKDGAFRIDGKGCN